VFCKLAAAAVRKNSVVHIINFSNLDFIITPLLSFVLHYDFLILG
jgi:hypothetical protein